MALTTTPSELTATALTLTTAAQPNITSVGTLTTLTVDNITVNGNTISSTNSDGDITIQGNDGGSTITALTLDMSEGGIATFAAKIHANKGVNFYTTDDQANYWVQYTHTDDTFRINYNGVGDDEVIMNTNGTLHLIGTDPTVKFQDSAGGDIFGTYVSNSLGFGVYNFTDSRQDFTIDGSGKVGIGITSGMDRDLHIKGSGSDVGIQIEKTGVDELRVAVDSTGPYLYAEGTAPLRFYQNNAEIIRIAGGLVGIGAAPNHSTLEVTGDKTTANNLQLTLRGATNTNKQLIMGFDTTADKSYITSQIAGSAQKPLIINASEVGIGTASPDVNSFGAGHGILTVQSDTGSAKTAMLNLSGDGNDTNATRVASLFFNDASATGGGKSLAGVEAYRASNHATDPGGDLLFSTNASGGSYTERMRIQSTGAIRNMGATMAPTSNTTESTFKVSFANGVANQKFKLILSNTWWGTFDVALTGTYSNQNMAGILAKRFGSGLNANSVYMNKSRILESLGATSQNFHIGDIEWDSSLSKWVIVITHRVSTGNALQVRVRTFAEPAGGGGQTDALSFTVGSVYTTDSTAYGEQKRIPCFHANLNSSVALSTNAIVFNAETFDSGSNYDTSNGRFTAPESGVYSFSMNLLIYPHSAGVLNPRFLLNGSQYGYMVQQSHPNNNHSAVVRTSLISMSRGQYVQVRVDGSSTNAGCNIHGSQSYFTGHLVAEGNP